MMQQASWLLLTHHIPPTPPYLRAKVMRRLTQAGALVLKRSAYLLPAGESTLEDFQWLRREIREEGGDAWIVEGRFVAGLTDDDIRERFRAMRAADYSALAAEARALLDRARGSQGTQGDATPDPDRRRLHRRVEATARIDFFHADGRDEVEALMATIERLPGGTDQTRPTARSRPDVLQARTWATRAGVKVDRMASAWLIRRFIDKACTFVFLEPDAPPEAGAVRFDMFEGEFTHDGPRCTFEVLLDASGCGADRGLAAIAEIVHDLDLHDDKYQRPETAGIGALLQGIVARFDDDHRRLAESTGLFDALYASLRGEGRRAPAKP